MNLQTIAEHTVDMDLLSTESHVLDAGCRGFDFGDELALIHGIKNICNIDIDDNLPNNGRWYYNLGISDFNGWVKVKKGNDPQATRIDNRADGFPDLVPVVTLKYLSKMMRVDTWDLIKMDIEGSEYEAIMSMERPYATQISVEFHTHCGQTEQQVQQCVDKLHSLGYKTIQHEKTARHGLKPNYWDSLFCL